MAASDLPRPTRRPCTACRAAAASECPGCGRELDPPHFCATCGTRLAVLVKPTGWRGRCKVHGEVAASDR